MAFDLLYTPCDLDLQLSVLQLQVHYLGLQLRDLAAVVYLLLVEFLNGLYLVE